MLTNQPTNPLLQVQAHLKVRTVTWSYDHLVSPLGVCKCVCTTSIANAKNGHLRWLFENKTKTPLRTEFSLKQDTYVTQRIEDAEDFNRYQHKALVSPSLGTLRSATTRGRRRLKKSNHKNAPTFI